MLPRNNMIPAAGTMRLYTRSGSRVEVELRPRMAPERPSNVDRLSKNSENRDTKSPAPNVMLLQNCFPHASIVAVTGSLCQTNEGTRVDGYSCM